MLLDGTPFATHEKSRCHRAHGVRTREVHERRDREPREAGYLLLPEDQLAVVRGLDLEKRRSVHEAGSRIRAPEERFDFVKHRDREP